MNIDNNLRQLLENETKIHLAEIRFLYQKLDRQLGLNGARVPITFGFDTDRLGAYTPGFGQDEEEFHFSLLFIGYCVTKPLSKDEAIAFGDGHNDIEMLEAVGIGVAMGNAKDEVKAKADFVCQSVENDGIYHYCVENKLIF